MAESTADADADARDVRLAVAVGRLDSEREAEKERAAVAVADGLGVDDQLPLADFVADALPVALLDAEVLLVDPADTDA